MQVARKQLLQWRRATGHLCADCTDYLVRSRTSRGLPAARSLRGRTHVAIGGALRLWPPLEASVRLTSCRSPLSVKLFRSACRNLAYNDFVGPLPTGIKDLITLVDMYAPDSALMRTALRRRRVWPFFRQTFGRAASQAVLVRV